MAQVSERTFITVSILFVCSLLYFTISASSLSSWYNGNIINPDHSLSSASSRSDEDFYSNANRKNDGDFLSSTAKTNEHNQQQHLTPLQTRYDETLFDRGRPLPEGETPLTIIRNISSTGKMSSGARYLSGKIHEESSFSSIRAKNENNSNINIDNNHHEYEDDNITTSSSNQQFHGYGWVFVQYHPSPFEQRWLQEATKILERPAEIDGEAYNPRATPLCNLARSSSKFENEFEIYNKQLNRMTPNDNDRDLHTSTNDNRASRNDDDADVVSRTEEQQVMEPLSGFDDTVFSKFEYVFKCSRSPCHRRILSSNNKNNPKIGDRKFSYIEPLVGLLRHPKVCASSFSYHHHNLDQNQNQSSSSSLPPNVEEKKRTELLSPSSFLYNKNYMLIDPWPLHHVGRSSTSPAFADLKRFYFDIGGFSSRGSFDWFQRVFSSSSSSLSSDPSRCTGSSSSSSPCFHPINIDFTDWFVYEAEHRDPKQFFKDLVVPPRIKVGFRWMNLFIKTEEESWDNPNNAILMEAHKEDVVILKIDDDELDGIDATIVEQIIKYPHLHQLIDELFFEHRVDVEILNDKSIWGTRRSSGKNHLDSLKLFSRLREVGVRAHSWPRPKN